MIKVTALMASRWVKAAFLAILGIVILLYANKLVDDLRSTMEGILVAWLFVDAALTVALSFSEHKYTLLDVMRRLDKIEKKLGIVEPPAKVVLPEEPEAEEEEAVREEEVPPPPKEEP